MDFQRWLREAAGELSASESPKRDAEILLEHVTGKARTYLLAFGETPLTAEQQAQLATLSRWRILSVNVSSGRSRFMSQRQR